jgi:hypothetical protein
MTCHQLQPYIIELARDRANPSAAVDGHLRTCDACAAFFDRERTLSAGLRRLAHDLEEPQDREAALLAAFDAVWQKPASARWPVVSGLAAAITIALVLTGRTGNAPSAPEISAAPDAFVAVEAAVQAATRCGWSARFLPR